MESVAQVMGLCDVNNVCSSISKVGTDRSNLKGGPLWDSRVVGGSGKGNP